LKPQGEIMRAAGPGDFTVDVEGIGRFIFGKRAMRDQIRIGVIYAELTEGVTPTPWLETVCTWIATLRQLMVAAPEDFDIEGLDPLDEDSYAKLLKVYAELRLKEGSFRRPPTSGGQTSGQGAGGNSGVLVSPEVQPHANRSTVS
jgi:hypothetical protein